MLRDFSKEKFDIIILAGQSNAEGYGFGPVEKTFEPNDRIWSLNGDDTISLAVEKVTGNQIQTTFGLYFAQEYFKNGHLAEGRNLLILRCAVGGTGFLDNRWKPEDDLFLHMMEMIRTALQMNPENRLVAFLWHQGETDAMNHASYEVHFKHLMTLVQLVRESFNAAELPFIAGDFVYHWKNANIEICAPVIDAIRDVCRDCGQGAFVETDELFSNDQDMVRPGDIIHFSRKSVYELGNRYYAKFVELIC